MTDVGPPPRRRGNGLPADKFVPLADVEPRLGEHLLDLLRFADIAAFLEPPADPRMAHRPGVGMVQRLYVEHGKRGVARDVVQAAAEEAGIPRGGEDAADGATDAQPRAAWSSTSQSRSGPGSRADDPLAGIDTDAEFAALIAGWDSPPPSRSERPARGETTRVPDDTEPGGDRAVPPGNRTNDAPDTGEATSTDKVRDTEAGDETDTELDDEPGDAADAEAAAQRRAALAEMAALDHTPVPPPGDELDELDAEEHYEPPAPPPLPVPEPATLGAAAVFIAGILVVAKGGWFGLSGDVSFPLGIVLVLAGFVLFVLRLRDSSGDEEDDGDEDDGARI